MPIPAKAKPKVPNTKRDTMTDLAMGSNSLFITISLGIPAICRLVQAEWSETGPILLLLTQ